MHLLEQQQPRLGQLDTPVDPVEQPCAQLRLQALHLLADRRLGGAQLHGGSGETAQAGGGLEHAQGVEGQVGKVLKHKLG